MRPLTAPARAGSRLAAGAARVSARSAAAPPVTKGAAGAEPRTGEDAHARGRLRGWRGGARSCGVGCGCVQEAS